MDTGFWQGRWEKNEIGFHEPEANPLLLKHFGNLGLPKGSRVFVPLCGKTKDIAWLLAQGYRVAGAELVEMAIQQLFSELGITPKISEAGTLKHYSAPNLDIFVGDIFQLTSAVLGAVDAVYDRAALVALPQETRDRYTKHLMALTSKAPQLLLCYEYDQNLMPGPPFAISPDEIARHYENRYTVRSLENKDVSAGLKGKGPVKESVWLLR